MGFEIVQITIKGEIPSMCFMCPLAAKFDGKSICSVKYQTRKHKNNHKYLVDAADSPPDFCPLELEPEPHVFESTEVGEPWGKPSDFSKNKTLGKWQMGQVESESE